MYSPKVMQKLLCKAFLQVPLQLVACNNNITQFETTRDVSKDEDLLLNLLNNY